MEVSRLGVKSELQLRPIPQPWLRATSAAYATTYSNAQILNLPSEARDQTHILTETMSGSCHNRNSKNFF